MTGLMIFPSQNKRHATCLRKADFEAKPPAWFSRLSDEEKRGIRKAFAELAPGESKIFLRQKPFYWPGMVHPSLTRNILLRG